MKSTKFLDYEVTLLLAKYGKRAVLEVLAKRLSLTQDELESILNERTNGTSVPRARKSPPSHEGDSVSKKARLLRTLRGHIRNQLFLPEVDDIRRFLEKHGRLLADAKTRSESLPSVFRLLSQLDEAELEALCQPEEAYSSLGIISDAIMRRKR